MTTYLGSVKKMPGHILVSTENLFRLSPLVKENWSISHERVKLGLQPIPYRFLSHERRIYYVNGRKQVYETDIINPVNVWFNPVGFQMRGNKKCYPIQFRLMEKVEWIFL